MIWILTLYLAGGAAVAWGTPYATQADCEAAKAHVQQQVAVITTLHPEHPQRLAYAACEPKPTVIDARR